MLLNIHTNAYHRRQSMSKKADYLRVPITMPPDMIVALEELSLKAKITGGKKLANTELVRAAVQFMLDAGVDVTGCKHEEDMLARMRANTQ